MKKIQHSPPRRIRAEFFYSESKEAQGKRARGVFLYVKENHLGNVLVTLSDRKTQVQNGSNTDYFMSDVRSYSDYAAFGAPLPGRHGGSYRYGFNSQEKDNEIASGVTAAEFWEYDSRLARRWNLDPVTKEWESSYAAFANAPIFFCDPYGDRIKYGTEGMSREDKKRIKKQVKGRMRTDKEFRKQIHAMRRDKETTYTFLDRQASCMDKGTNRTVTARSINEVDLEADQYTGKGYNPKNDDDHFVFICWNTDALPKPDNILFNSDAVTIADPNAYEKAKNAKAEDIEWNIQFKNTTEMYDLATWIQVHHDYQITFNIYDDDWRLDTKRDGDNRQTITEKLTGDQLYRARVNTIKSALAPYLTNKEMQQLIFVHQERCPWDGTPSEEERARLADANCRIVYSKKEEERKK